MQTMLVKDSTTESQKWCNKWRVVPWAEASCKLLTAVNNFISREAVRKREGNPPLSFPESESFHSQSASAR